MPDDRPDDRHDAGRGPQDRRDPADHGAFPADRADRADGPDPADRGGAGTDAAGPDAPHPPAAPAAIPARRLLTGDRLCTGCGHNLVNQPIVREEVYGLLVVRCPECGAVAPLQEYPLLGRWAGRLAALGAATWAAALVLTILGTGIACFVAGMIAWGRHWARGDDWIEAVHRRDPSNPSFRTWFATADRAEVHRQVLELAGPDWSVPGAAVSAALAAPAAFGGGVVLSLLLLHRRIAGRVLAAAMVGFVGMAALAWFHSVLDGTGGWHEEAIFLTTGWRVVAAGIGVAVLFTVLGAVVGRAVTRAVVRLGVPPRMRGALAFLWLADGRPLPRGVARPPRPPRPPSPPTGSSPPG